MASPQPVERTCAEKFGISGATLARVNQNDPQTPGAPAVATTETPTLSPPRNAARALLDPKGSALFWVALAAVLGLLLITGQVKFEAALGSRMGAR